MGSVSVTFPTECCAQNFSFAWFALLNHERFEAESAHNLSAVL